MDRRTELNRPQLSEETSPAMHRVRAAALRREAARQENLANRISPIEDTEEITVQHVRASRMASNQRPTRTVSASEALQGDRNNPMRYDSYVEAVASSQFPASLRQFSLDYCDRRRQNARMRLLEARRLREAAQEELRALQLKHRQLLEEKELMARTLRESRVYLDQLLECESSARPVEDLQELERRRHAELQELVEENRAMLERRREREENAVRERTAEEGREQAEQHNVMQPGREREAADMQVQEEALRAPVANHVMLIRTDVNGNEEVIAEDEILRLISGNNADDSNREPNVSVVRDIPN